MMRHGFLMIGLVALLSVVISGVARADGVSATAQEKSFGTVISGTLTARDGDTVSLTTADGKVYTVDTAHATVMLDRLPNDCVCLVIGDKMRIYGELTDDCHIKAARVHIFPSETRPVTPPATTSTCPAAPSCTVPAGAGPTPCATGDYDVELPSVGSNLGGWQNRGLVLSIDYREKTITIGTSKGTFSIDASVATVIQGSKSVSIARVSEGDIIRIWGELGGVNTVVAERIQLVGQRDFQTGNVPLQLTSVRGQITNIDYPSFTITIITPVGLARVMVDERTCIQQEKCRKAFQNLAIGQMVKVYGVGTMNSGYAASQVLIIGDPGR